MESALLERQSNLGKITQLQEQVALLRDRLFGRKSEQTSDPESPQLPLLNEAEVLAERSNGDGEDEDEDDVESIELRPVAVSKPRGKRQSLPAELPRIEVVHELPEHELTCECGCRKHVMG